MARPSLSLKYLFDDDDKDVNDYDSLASLATLYRVARPFLPSFKYPFDDDDCG